MKKDEKTGVVYKFDCSCKKSYIRETKRNVKTKFKDHEKDIEFKNIFTPIKFIICYVIRHIFIFFYKM